MTSRITSYIAPAIPVQIPGAYSPTDELLMLIGAATSGGAAPPVETFHILVQEGAQHKVLYHNNDLVTSQ